MPANSIVKNHSQGREEVKKALDSYKNIKEKSGYKSRKKNNAGFQYLNNINKKDGENKC